MRRSAYYISGGRTIGYTLGSCFLTFLLEMDRSAKDNSSSPILEMDCAGL